MDINEARRKCDEKTDSNDEDDSRAGVADEADVASLAPDGGWGWVVCFATFLITGILDGTSFSFGILLIDLLDFFQESRSKTAWVGSTLFGMCMIMGPVVSFLLKFYSCRQIVISGTLITVVSFIASVFSPSVDVLIITYGLIAGIGTGMIFIPAIIIVGLYFNKKRAIATGIASSGSGFGVFIYGYLCEYLLEQFDWRGTILILAGILLNCAACGAVFRPIVEQKLKRRLRLIKEKERVEKETRRVSEKSDLLSLKSNHSNDEKKEFNSDLEVSIQSPLIVHGHSKSEQQLTSLEDRSVFLSTPLLSHSSHLTDRSVTKLCKPSQNRSLRPESRIDLFYSGSLHRLPEYKDCENITSFVDKMTIKNDMEKNSNSAGSELTFWKKVVNKTSLWLFNDPVFILLLVVFSMWTAHSITLTYFPDMAVSKGIHRSQAAILISIVGVTNTLGRIIAGFFHDMLHIKGTTLYIVALFTAAVVNFVIPQFNQFSWLAACAGVFGFCMAVAVSMRIIVLTEQLGIYQLTASFGMVAFFQGITFMLDPPVAGLLYGINDSYTLSFVLAGSMYAVSCVSTVVISCIRREKSAS